MTSNEQTKALRLTTAALAFALAATLTFGLPVGGYWERVRFSLLAGALAGAVTAPIASERWIDRLTALLPIAWMVGIGGWMLLP